MGGLDVFQRTSDKMFNATDLLKRWNSANPYHQRDLENFWKSTNLNEFMKEIVENECNFKSVEFTDLKNMLSKTSRGKHNGGTWMNPTLFTKFAMYLSPKFEYHAIRFISDQMINYRKSAGDEYISLGSAIQKIVGNSFIQVAMKKVSDAMNWVVFNQSARGERNNHGEESSQFELAELERTISMLINEGFIRSYDQLINYLRKKWQEKYQPKVLQS